MNVGSLFSGIGGFDLGLERAGMHTSWFVEREPYCQRVLAKHWPGVPCYDDVRTVGSHNLEPVDVLCGGFPCQDISTAGAGAGITGSRSGLWTEYARIIGELQPRYVVVENVAALRYKGKGLYRVLGDLAALGYDAEWDCIPASAVGAPHRRDRIWIVAYPNGRRVRGGPVYAEAHGTQTPNGRQDPEGDAGSELRIGCRLASANRQCRAVGREPGVVVGTPRETEEDREQRQRSRDAADNCGAALGYPDSTGSQGHRGLVKGSDQRPAAATCRGSRTGQLAYASSITQREQDDEAGAVAWTGSREGSVRGGQRGGSGGWPSPWEFEPDVGRVAHGVPARVDRLRALGNALVPQIAQYIGEQIMIYEGA